MNLSLHAIYLQSWKFRLFVDPKKLCSSKNNFFKYQKLMEKLDGHLPPTTCYSYKVRNLRLL